MKVCIILGTRPEIIKLCSIIRQCEEYKLPYFIIHTGQHYSYNMDEIFFQELELPQPRYKLDVGSGSHGKQTGIMLEKIEAVLMEERPSFVIVEGDTNTVLAGALAAVKLQMPVVHVEAGLRSYFREMPEELNRIIVDHISDYLFVPTDKARQNALKEGISADKIFVTGNTIVDAVYQNVELSKKRESILSSLGVKEGGFFLVTSHRQENVDVKDKLEGIFSGLKKIYEEYKLPMIYPIHPRTKKMMDSFGISQFDGINFIEPVGFVQFLQLESGAKLVLTDSGGVQEECCILKVPCVTLRDNTERPETIDVGANILAGTDPVKIFEGAKKMLSKKREWKNPFGDGTAAKIMIDILRKKGV
jgi:UDP-N-acetylglucosamine 2-epimerase (non-hydrolysing)